MRGGDRECNNNTPAKLVIECKCTYERDGKKEDNTPRGTCQTPCLCTVNSFSCTLTSTVPDCTLKTMCMDREFFVRFIWSGPSSMSPQLKKEPPDPILAYLKPPSPVSRGCMPFSAHAMAAMMLAIMKLGEVLMRWGERCQRHAVTLNHAIC
jgi:hypothetical protein